MAPTLSPILESPGLPAVEDIPEKGDQAQPEEAKEDFPMLNATAHENTSSKHYSNATKHRAN